MLCCIIVYYIMTCSSKAFDAAEEDLKSHFGAIHIYISI